MDVYTYSVTIRYVVLSLLRFDDVWPDGARRVAPFLTNSLNLYSNREIFRVVANTTTWNINTNFCDLYYFRSCGMVSGEFSSHSLCSEKISTIQTSGAPDNRIYVGDGY